MDAYAVADAILADHFGDGSGGGAEVYSDDILISEDADLESVPESVEQGVKEKQVVEYDQWKKLDAEELRRGIERGKERERLGWDEVYRFLTSASAS